MIENFNSLGDEQPNFFDRKGHIVVETIETTGVYRNEPINGVLDLAEECTLSLHVLQGIRDGKIKGCTVA